MNTDFRIVEVMNASSYNDAENLEKHFNRIAGLLMNRIVLIVNKNRYRLTEIEFYYYSTGYHEDPYIHRNKLQLLAGQWYFHGSGLDITFGDGTNYGGILIRGIKLINRDKPVFIDGPLNVVQEIFSAFGNVSYKEHTLTLIETDDLPVEEIVRSTRVGLKDKEPAGFKDKYYRYLTFPFEASHDYKEKTRVAQLMLNGDKQLRSYSQEEINAGFNWKVIK